MHQYLNGLQNDERSVNRVIENQCFTHTNTRTHMCVHRHTHIYLEQVPVFPNHYITWNMKIHVLQYFVFFNMYLFIIYAFLDEY